MSKLFIIMILATLLTAGFIFADNANAADRLDLNAYFRQVKEGNASFKAAVEAKEGAELRYDDGTIVLTPILNANANLNEDGSPTANTAIQGTKTIRNNYSLGVSQQFRSGTKLGFTYYSQYYEIQGASPVFYPQTKFNDGKPTLELTQSLWRNFFGVETRAQEHLAQATAKASEYQQSFLLKTKQVEAEKAYWGVVFAKETVRVQKESYDRAVKLRDWNKRRVQMQLGDRSDLLQAEAALELRGLDLQMGENDLAAQSRQFNSLRGLSSDVVSENLIPVSEINAKDLIAATKDQRPREDVLASLEQLKGAEYSAKLGVEKTRPTLELTGSYAYDGRSDNLNDSFKNSWKGTNKIWTAGIRFQTSLNFGLVYDVRDGYRKDERAASLNFERKMFEESQEWKDLSQKFEDSKKRLVLTKTIEETQNQKLSSERERFNRGRTTTFQVIQFEQEYATAQLNRLKNENEVIQLASQLKLFGAE